MISKYTSFSLNRLGLKGCLVSWFIDLMIRYQRPAGALWKVKFHFCSITHLRLSHRHFRQLSSYTWLMCWV